MQSHKAKLTFSYINFFYYVAVAVLLLVFFLMEFDLTTNFLIAVIILTGIPSIVQYILFKQYKSIKRIGNIVWSSLLILTCIVLLCIPDLSISTVCIVWGVFDIVRGLNEVYIIFFDGKFEAHEIPFFILALMDIVLGIILIIKLGDGLNVHLIAATISVFVNAIYRLIEVIALTKRISINGKD